MKVTSAFSKIYTFTGHYRLQKYLQWNEAVEVFTKQSSFTLHELCYQKYLQASNTLFCVSHNPTFMY